MRNNHSPYTSVQASTRLLSLWTQEGGRCWAGFSVSVSDQLYWKGSEPGPNSAGESFMLTHRWKVKITGFSLKKMGVLWNNAFKCIISLCNSLDAPVFQISSRKGQISVGSSAEIWSNNCWPFSAFKGVGAQKMWVKNHICLEEKAREWIVWACWLSVALQYGPSLC